MTGVVFTEDPVTLVAKVDNTQMGVTVQLGGINNWRDYLEAEVEANDLDDDLEEIFLAKYDGY